MYISNMGITCMYDPGYGITCIEKYITGNICVYI